MSFWLPVMYGLSLAVTQPSASTPSYKILPWHLADVDLEFGDMKDVRSIEVDLQLFDPVPDIRRGKQHALFVVPLAGNLCGKEFYTGTRTGAFQTGTKGDFGKVLEHGYVFTQFGTESPTAVRPAKEGYSLLSDHEGPLSSVRRSGTFEKGVYTFKLSASKHPKDPREGERTEVELTVTAHVDGSTTKVGALVFQGGESPLKSRVTAFCEVVQNLDWRTERWRTGDDNPADQIPNIRYAVGNWRIDGKRVRAKTITAFYQTNVPQRAKVYLLDECPELVLKKTVSKTLADEDTLIYIVSDEVHYRSGEKVHGGKYEFVGERLTAGGTRNGQESAQSPPWGKNEVSRTKPSPPGGGEAKPY